MNRKGFARWFGLLLSFCVTFSASVSFGQSGRRHETKNTTPAKKPPGPIAEPDPSFGSVDKKAPEAKDGGGEVDPNDVVRISSNLVPIPASVVDSRGNAITNLKLVDFELWIDGLQRNISELTRSETSVRLAMLFDNSGSLDAARDFEKEAAIHFFKKVMRPIDEASIFSIGTESFLAQPLTRDLQKLQLTIETFGRPEGSTSLFDAIVDAAAYLRPYSGRRVLVIVSDGIDTTSRADFDMTVQRVLSDDCQVFVVQTGLYEGANLRALAAERRMEQLSSQTGGAVYIPRSVADLNAAFEQIAADLAHQYVLSYYPAGNHRDGRFHAIELKLKSRKDVRIRSRKGYYSPKPDPAN
jgi:VWFA-related protein